MVVTIFALSKYIFIINKQNYNIGYHVKYFIIISYMYIMLLFLFISEYKCCISFKHCYNLASKLLYLEIHVRCEIVLFDFTLLEWSSLRFYDVNFLMNIFRLKTKNLSTHCHKISVINGNHLERY